MQLAFIHRFFVFENDSVCLIDDVCARLAAGNHAVVVFLRGVEAGAAETVEDVGQQVAFLERGIAVGRVRLGVVRLRLEADAAEPESEREEVRAELFGGVVVEKLGGHRRLYLAAAAGFFIEEKYVIVRHERRQRELTFFGLSGEVFLALLAHEHRHFRDAVEVDVVLPDELEDFAVFGKPPFLPFVVRRTLGLKISLCERDRCPEGFGPYPYGQSAFAFERRSGDAPFNVAGEAEGDERFAGAETYAVLGQYLARAVAHGQLVELEHEGGFAFFRAHRVLRQ